MDKDFIEKCSQKTVIEVDYHTIEDLINKYYKNTKTEDYELPAFEERGSGDGYTWEVSVRKRKLSKYELSDIQAIKNGKWEKYCTRQLLTDLCNNGIIPEGDYLIDVSW